MKRFALVVVVSLSLLVLTTPAVGKSVPHTEILVAAGRQAILLTPAQGSPGDLIAVHATGFNCHNGTAVAIVTFDGTGANGAGSAIHCDSTFSTSFQVPTGALPGPHAVVAEGLVPPPAPPPPAAATATATTVPTVTPTPDCSVASCPQPTDTGTPVPAVTGTSSPTTTPTPPPTNTPIPPTSTAGPAIETISSRDPTLTPIVLPRVSPASPPPSLRRTVGQGAGMRYQLAVVQHAAAPLGMLIFDGDKASVTFQVVSASAGSFPFTVTQSGTCSARPIVGVTTPCTIIETVTNTSNDPLDFSHTVANHLAANVRFVSATATTGSVSVSGSNVVWNDFELAPHQSAQATVQVSFTPTASQVGSAVILSDGISADAADVTTGKRYAMRYGTLAINLTVAAASAPPASQTPPPTAAPTSPSGPSTESQQGTSGLPTTGGGGVQTNLEYLAP